MSHVSDQLNARGLNHISLDFIYDVAKQFKLAAILIERLSESIHCPDGSNGNCVWLIVRNFHPITIMLRRDGQPTNNLRVDEIIDMS